MKNLKIKIIVGYNKNQYYTVSAEEAHKAYYLFLNPESRGVFDNGVALIGKNITGIEPDYIATMGWNEGYSLQADDYVEIRDKGIDRKIREALSAAKDIAIRDSNLINIPLSEALEKTNYKLLS